MRKSSLLLFLFLVTLTGCVVTYGNFPDARVESLPKEHVPNPFSYRFEREPGGEFTGSGEILTRFIVPNLYPVAIDVHEAEFLEVRNTLEASGMFSQLSEAPGPPEQGIHCDFTFVLRRPSNAAEMMSVGQGALMGGLGGPGLLILFVWDWIPYYSGEGGVDAHFRLFKDGVPQKTYHYEIKKKSVGGILILPFAWVNFFTDDLKEALRKTTLQFLIDAQHDENL